MSGGLRNGTSQPVRSSGRLSEHISSTHDYAYNVAIDGSGVYVVGYDHNGAGSNAEWRVEKRNLTTGTLIWGLSEHISSDYDYSNDIAVDVSGVYVVGARLCSRQL